MPEGATRASSTRVRRDTILAAALTVFLKRGVAGASMEEIRARSGASIGSIYHHFDGKGGIATALYVEALGDYQRGLLDELGSHAEAHPGVEGVVHHHLAWVASHADLARFLLLGRDTEVRLASERTVRELNRRFYASVMDWVEPHAQRGELRDLPLDLLYALWLGPSQELARQWLARRDVQQLPAAATTLAAAAWRVLRTEEA